jgi:hypothetical protein
MDDLFWVTLNDKKPILMKLVLADYDDILFICPEENNRGPQKSLGIKRQSLKTKGDTE